MRYTHSGASTVLDIWTGKARPAAALGGTLNTDAFGPHDSRFSLISPA